MKCLYCGRKLEGEIGVCRTCRAAREAHAQVTAAKTPSGKSVGQFASVEVPTISRPFNRVVPVIAGIIFGAALFAFVLSDAFYFAAFGTAARTGSEAEDAYLDLTLGREFNLSGTVLDVSTISSQLEAAGVGRPLKLVAANNYAQAGILNTNIIEVPKKLFSKYIHYITPLSNEPLFKGPAALALKGRRIKFHGFKARVNSGRIGSQKVEFSGGETKLIYISTVILDDDSPF